MHVTPDGMHAKSIIKSPSPGVQDECDEAKPDGETDGEAARAPSRRHAGGFEFGQHGTEGAAVAGR